MNYQSTINDNKMTGSNTYQAPELEVFLLRNERDICLQGSNVDGGKLNDYEYGGDF